MGVALALQLLPGPKSGLPKGRTFSPTLSARAWMFQTRLLLVLTGLGGSPCRLLVRRIQVALLRPLVLAPRPWTWLLPVRRRVALPAKVGLLLVLGPHLWTRALVRRARVLRFLVERFGKLTSGLVPLVLFYLAMRRS